MTKNHKDSLESKTVAVPQHHNELLQSAALALYDIFTTITHPHSHQDITCIKINYQLIDGYPYHSFDITTDEERIFNNETN